MSERAVRETRIHHGGLFRCCLASISDYLSQRETCRTGDVLITSCCREQVRLDEGGVWRWLPSEATVEGEVRE